MTAGFPYDTRHPCTHAPLPPCLSYRPKRVISFETKQQTQPRTHFRIHLHPRWGHGAPIRTGTTNFIHRPVDVPMAPAAGQPVYGGRKRQFITIFAAGHQHHQRFECVERQFAVHSSSIPDGQQHKRHPIVDYPTGTRPVATGLPRHASDGLQLAHICLAGRHYPRIPKAI